MGSGVTIIAEAGVNHNGSIATAYQMIEAAADAGADYVKFQTFRADRLASVQAEKAKYQLAGTDSKQSQYEMLKALELSERMHDQLITHCAACNIKFLSTAFDTESLTFLDKLGVDLIKIPSGEITNLPYLRKVATLEKPVVLSTGMCTLGDVEQALSVLTTGLDREQLTVLHCNTQYPTPMTSVNLNAMRTLARAFKVRVGYSDHTLGIEVPIAAVAMGAICIEKHFTLDRAADGPDHRASLEPDELREMVAAIRNIEVALGDGIKRPSDSERPNIAIARKSVHTSRALPAGHVLTEGDLVMLRPGDGISPMRLDELLGKALKGAVRRHEKLDYRQVI